MCHNRCCSPVTDLAQLNVTTTSSNIAMHALIGYLLLPFLCLAAAGARLWWRYAITVVQRQQQSYSSRAWKQLRMLSYYQRYVTAYLRYLQQGKQGSGDPTIDTLDGQLDEAVILLFRRMAHARWKELKAKASAAADVKQPPQQQTWIGWLWGTPAKAAPQQLTPGEAAGSADEIDTSMGVQEWNKLEDVLAQQAVRWPHKPSLQRRMKGGCSAYSALPAHTATTCQIHMQCKCSSARPLPCMNKLLSHGGSLCGRLFVSEIAANLHLCVWFTSSRWQRRFCPCCIICPTPAGCAVRGPERVPVQGQVCAAGAGVCGSSRAAGCWRCAAHAGIYGRRGQQGSAVPCDSGPGLQCIHGAWGQGCAVGMLCRHSLSC